VGASYRDDKFAPLVSFKPKENTSNPTFRSVNFCFIYFLFAI
jgi:hypothetical protein